jgi:hypothetical protein
MQKTQKLKLDGVFRLNLTYISERKDFQRIDLRNNEVVN